MSGENKMTDADIRERLAGFGNRFRKMRRDADLSLRELAPVFGVTYATIGKYERVLYSYPSIPMLAKIAIFFNTSIDYLLLGKEPAYAPNNNVSGALMNSTVIQAGRNNNSSLNNATSCSSEALGLLDIYNKLTLKDRLRLLNFAVELDEGSGQE